jgi:VIT1/CCC1 family predicted Fe2+/Mn2+ transporter
MKATHMTSGSRQSFVQRHLDPGDRLAETLCGLIMVLTFTLGAGLTLEDAPGAATSLLLAAIGCNLAWGIIDGVLYVLTAMSQRSARVRFIHAVHQAPDEATALTYIRSEVDDLLAALVTPDAREALCRDALTHLRSDTGAANAVTQAKASKITADDLAGAVAIFWLELLACVPAVVPFIIFAHHPGFALRLSNGVMIVALFVVGQQWASYVGLNRLLTGVLMSSIGLVLVGVALLLGG